MRCPRAPLAGLVLLLFGSFTLGVTPTAAFRDTGDKILHIQWNYIPDTLDPQQADWGQVTMSALAFEGLTRLDEELDTVPAAAESWEFSPDGLTLTFHLREGLVYSDGSPLTAERFRYAIQRQCDPRHAFDDASNLFAIVGCEALKASLDGHDGTPAAAESAYEAAIVNLGARAIDDRTLELRLTRPAPYLPAIAAGPGFLPVKQELVEAGGPEWWLDPANWVGNGPFQVDVIDTEEPEQRIRLLRNEHYWGGQAKLDGIEYRVINGQEAFDAYLRGDLDIIWGPSGVISYADIEADPVLSRQLLVGPVSFTGVFHMNQTREPFTDKKVREAFAYAFDREDYCRVLEAGTCTPTLSWIPPGVPGAIETDAYAFDPDKARQALAESSYGGPENLPPILWYTVPSDDPWQAQFDQWIIDQIHTILGVELVLTEVTAEEREILDGDDPSIRPQIGSYLYYSDLPDPHDWMSFWLCGAPTFATGIGYCNPEFDALVERADSGLDPEARLALFEEAGRMLVADAPSIFAYTPTNAWLIKPYVTGYSRTALNQHWPGWWTPLTVDLERPT